MTVLYRSTGGDNPKNRPTYYSKLLCLKSFLISFRKIASTSRIIFVNDGPMLEDRLEVMRRHGEIVSLDGIGNSPSYRKALSMALELPDDEIVYFAEDDYLYTDVALEKLLTAFHDLPFADYVTLFDHLDRYVRKDDARRRLSRIHLSGGLHWRTVESTCMTFGARVKSLRRDAWIDRLFTSVRTPRDRSIWRLKQGQKQFLWKFPKATLIGPMPGLATHMDPLSLAPNVDWEKVAEQVSADTSLSALEQFPVDRELTTAAK